MFSLVASPGRRQADRNACCGTHGWRVCSCRGRACGSGRRRLRSPNRFAEAGNEQDDPSVPGRSLCQDGRGDRRRHRRQRRHRSRSHHLLCPGWRPARRRRLDHAARRRGDRHCQCRLRPGPFDGRPHPGGRGKAPGRRRHGRPAPRLGRPPCAHAGPHRAAPALGRPALSRHGRRHRQRRRPA
jgi:hypothetical protein